jgi:hypothetical protein
MISAWNFGSSRSAPGVALAADSLSSRFAALMIPAVNAASFRSTWGVATRFDRSASCLSRLSADAAMRAKTLEAASVAETT